MPQSRVPLRPVLLELLRLAWPMVLAQVAFLGMILTDTLIAGRYSANALAGVSLGAAVVMPGYNLLMGMSLAVAPAVARLLGEQRPRMEIAAWVRGAAMVALSAWVLLMIVLQWVASPIAEQIAPDVPVQLQMQSYLRASTWGLPFMGLFFLLRNVLESHSVSRPVMWWGIAVLPVNALLDWLLIHGVGPIPPLGAMGCGLATALVQIALGLGLYGTFRRHSATRDLALWRGAGRGAGFSRWDKRGATDFFRLGFPVGMSLLAESSLFALGGLLMARYGTAAVGAHQISITIAALVFMMQVALGQATAVLLGRALGGRDFALLRRTATLGVALGLILALLVSAVFYGGRMAIPSLFSANPEVLSYAAVFMVWAAIFHLADAMQAIHAAALRGIHETGAIMRLTLPAYWLLSIPLMLWWAFRADAPASSIWWAFSAGLLVAALLLMWRFWSCLRELERTTPMAN